MQTAPEREAEQAQALFRRGLELSQEQRWLEARDAYQRSLRLLPRASTYYNLAVVSLHLGFASEALEALDSFDRLKEPDTHAEFEREAVVLRQRSLSQVGQLALTVEPESAAVELDGVAQESLGPARSFRVDPGEHVLRVSALGTESRVLRFSVGPREILSQHVSLSRIVEAQSATLATTTGSEAPNSAREQRVDDSHEHAHRTAPSQHDVPAPRRKRVLLWGGLAAVVVIAGAVTAGMLTKASRDDGSESSVSGGNTNIVFFQ